MESRFEIFVSGAHDALRMINGSTNPGVPPPPRSRIAFFGGSFDPPHRGHLELARAVLHAARMDRLFFIPATRNPLKESGPRASGADRLAMLHAAIGDEDRLGVIDWELMRSSPSYTLDTVTYLEARFPQAERFWIIGADQLPGLSAWSRIEELVSRVTFLVLARPGTLPIDPAIHGLRLEWIKAPLFPISSTEIRTRLGQGLPVDNFVPPPVLDFLSLHPDLYR